MGGYKTHLLNFRTPELLNSRTHLLPFEWVVLAYALLTTVYVLFFWGRLVEPWPMLWWRVGSIATTLLLWQAYCRWPNRWTMMLRVGAQLVMLSWWYPDTYELNRIWPNLDHVFASCEQWVFGSQPALWLSQKYSSAWVSELLSLGYVSYFPMIASVAVYYAFFRYERLAYAAFVILGSFFLFYVVFVALPVAGPQFYFYAVGCDKIAAGVFPDVGNYFLTHRESLPAPGQEGGFFHQLLLITHAAGERPTAAFPSSHVGICTVLLWLAWEARSRRLFLFLLPLAILMFFATFYVQAHYVIDAVSGLLAGTLFYCFLNWIYRIQTK